MEGKTKQPSTTYPDKRNQCRWNHGGRGRGHGWNSQNKNQ